MTAFDIDRFTTSGASDLAFGIRGEITTTFPQTALGARATTVLAEPPRTSWSAAERAPPPQVTRRTWHVQAPWIP
jgi:hypothetical protein